MTIVKMKSVLKKLISSWWFTPAVGIVSFGIPLVMHTQMTKAVENLLYPDSGWIGAVSFRLNDVPGYTGKSDLDLILLTHHFGDNRRVTFLRNGSAPESVAAGAPVASLVVDRPKARTSGVPLFDVDLPPETLVATSISAPRGSPRSQYTMIAAQCTKDLSANGDLIVLTRNELRNTRINYGLSLLALGLAAVFMPRYAHLLHPDDPE
jgi:hypothetical protein